MPTSPRGSWARGCSAASASPVIVDNRPGAGGVVGQELVLQAPADGYTLVIGTTGTLYVSPLMAGKPSMLADFTPASPPTARRRHHRRRAGNSRFRSWA